MICADALFFLVWFEYSSKYDWFLWIWVDYRFGVQWGSAGHAAYIPYALPDPCLHDAAVVCQVARAPFVKSPDLHTVETGRDECHCIERERGKPWVIINQQYYKKVHIPSVVFHPMRVQSRLTCCGRLCVFDLFQFPVISREMRIRKSLQIMWA